MRARGSGPLFLVELVVMILVFALCAAVLLNLFAAARQTLSDSRQLSSAVVWAESAASSYKAERGELPAAAARLSDMACAAGDGFRLELDGNWSPVDSGGSYVLSLSESEPGSASVSVTGAEGQIFSIPVRAY